MSSIALYVVRVTALRNGPLEFRPLGVLQIMMRLRNVSSGLLRQKFANELHSTIAEQSIPEKSDLTFGQARMSLSFICRSNPRPSLQN